MTETFIPFKTRAVFDWWLIGGKCVFLLCVHRTDHRQARGGRGGAASQRGCRAGIGAAGGERRRGRHLQQSAQDGQHVLHQHRLRPVREEWLPRSAHQHDQKQSRHVSARPGEQWWHSNVETLLKKVRVYYIITILLWLQILLVSNLQNSSQYKLLDRNWTVTGAHCSHLMNDSVLNTTKRRS